MVGGNIRTKGNNRVWDIFLIGPSMEKDGKRISNPGNSLRPKYSTQKID